MPDNSSILKHSACKVEVQKYTTQYTYADYKNNAGVYEWRKNKKGKFNIVELYHYDCVDESEPISCNRHTLKC